MIFYEVKRLDHDPRLIDRQYDWWFNWPYAQAISPTCLAADLSVLLAPTVWQCRRSSWQPSPTNRAFPVVGPRTWNDLPDDVTSAESLSTFRQRLKTKLTCLPNPFSDYSLDWTSPNLSLVDLAVVCIT